jgi:hypothetical protein
MTRSVAEVCAVMVSSLSLASPVIRGDRGSPGPAGGLSVVASAACPLRAQARAPGRPSGAAKEKKQTEAGDGPRADALDPRIGAAGRRSGGERLEQAGSSKTVE